jgi:hypothetical protein
VVVRVLVMALLGHRHLFFSREEEALALNVRGVFCK